jgi:guanylate kinase
MNKIYALFGKSCSGKSSIESILSQNGFHKATSYTTRPPRNNERDGVDYYFIDNQTFENMRFNNEFVEYRNYKERWYYGLTKKEIDLSIGNWVVVVDLQGLEELKEYYGKENVVGIYLYADDRERLLRYLLRDANCDVKEVIRRYNADEEDFSDERIKGKFTLSINNINAIDTINIILRNIKS